MIKTYKFLAEIKRDKDEWLVCCPTMERYGGFAGGDTKEEAWNYCKEILTANIETMLELGMPVPEEPEHLVSLKENQRFLTVRPKPETPPKKGHTPKTYKFQAVIEPDEDQWFACCPALETRGAATGGITWEEAYINIHQVLRMTLESMIEYGETIPADALELSGETIAVTV